MTYTIVGVVGHVNHGKSTLVRVLTGIDTDTLHEEKRRGITIDIGFASFTEGSHRFAIIDAPGHQKYIGNLLVGVSSIDIGLLIVACDQGIQQQTLEHASIIRAIGVKKLIVAISRIDLADAKTVADLSDELELFLGELGFNEIPIFPVSSVSGDGFDRLKSQMCSYASDLANSDATENDGDFRMPIDRVFTVEGRGLIVAGTIWSGQVRIGDTLEIARCKTSFRVRGIESHGERVESSLRGIRTAINLVGATMDGISRGDELITPGFLIENEQLVVSLEVFADSKEIKCPCTVQLHTATQAFTAHLLGQNILRPGTKSVVIVRPKQTIATTFSQACLFRKPYPVGSFASGRVLATSAKRGLAKERLIKFGERILDATEHERLVAAVELLGEWKIDPRWCSSQLGIETEALDIVIQSILNEGKIVKIGDSLVSTEAVRNTESYIKKTLALRAQSAEHAWIVEKALLVQAGARVSAKTISFALEQLIKDGSLVRINGMIAVATEQTAFTKKQQQALQNILALFKENRSPPTVKEITEKLHLSVDTVTSLVRFALQQRILIDIDPKKGLLIATNVFESLCAELATLLAQEPNQSVSAIRVFWNAQGKQILTRKHVVPLLEYCDRMQITIRNADLRKAGPQLRTESKLEKCIEKE